MIIYSDDPRGVKAALKEETAKGHKVRLRNARYKPAEARTEAEETVDLHDLTKAQLQALLRDMGIPFETDANKPRLIELLEGA